MDSNQIKLLETEARKIVSSIVEQNPNVIAAYSDGSFAREDMVRGSDVDIGFVVEEGHGQDKIQRTVIDETLFEWGFFEKHHYEDIASVLENAGMVHDIANAKIWHDSNNFLKNIQTEIRKKYNEPKSIKTRAENQLKIVRENFDELKEQIEHGDQKKILSHYLSIVRHLFAIPSAILNKPVTNCRAYLYCKRDANELRHKDFPNDVLKIFGSYDITPDKVRELLELAHKLYEQSDLPKDEIKTYRTHFEIVDYMLEINEPAGAMWPLFFWIAGPLGRSQFKSEKIEKHVLKSLTPILKELKLFESTDISKKFDLILNAINKADQMITEKLHIV